MKALVLIGLVLGMASPFAIPAVAAYTIEQSVIANGGGTGSGNNLGLEGTAGQSAIGTMSSDLFSSEAGFWYQYEEIVTGMDEGLPMAFSMGQNYPNPFNPVTTIQFAVPEAAKVTLKIYDVRGRAVRILVDEVLEPGYYRRDFNARGLSSGVYFYRMVADQFVEKRKLVLLK